MASMFRQNFSTGMNYLRRRFSSDDLYQERDDDNIDAALSAASTGSYDNGKPAPATSKLPSMTSFPSLSSVQDMTRGILSQAAAAASSATSAVTAAAQGTVGNGGNGTAGGAGFGGFMAGNPFNVGGAFSSEQLQNPQRIVYSQEKCKVLLVIDDAHTDWSRFFRGRRIFGDWELRVEQAEFANINVAAYSETGALVDVRVNKDGQETIRSFQPDFVLIRQHARDANDNWKHTILALHYGGLPAVNSLESVYNFLDKPWIFSHLLKIQRRLGQERFPLISQSFYPNYREMASNLWMLMPKFPLVVKIGHAHSGMGKVKVESHYAFQDVASVMAVTGCYSTTEPLVDSQCDIYIQKIGSNYRAFMRKAMSGNWKANVGAAILEQIPITDRYKLWVDECSHLFGGLDILAVKAIRGRDGREYIIEVDDCTMPLLGNTKEDDMRIIAELTISRLQTCCKPTPSVSVRATAQAANAVGPTSATSSPAMTSSYANGGVSGTSYGPQSNYATMTSSQSAAATSAQATSSPLVNRSMSAPPPLTQTQHQPTMQQYRPQMSAQSTPMSTGPQQPPPQRQLPRQPAPPSGIERPVNNTAPPPSMSMTSSVAPSNGGFPKQQNQQYQQPYSVRATSGPPSPGTVAAIARDLEAPEADDTMNNLRKTFAGIFGNM